MGVHGDRALFPACEGGVFEPADYEDLFAAALYAKKKKACVCPGYKP